jgi:ParB-like chromosome segregation protein Spo0J
MNTIIQEVPLSEFDLSLASVRIVNPARILQIEKSMRVHGQLQAVIARVHEDKYQLIDGFKRFFASENLLIEALQCRVLDIDLQQTHSLDPRSLAKLIGYRRKSNMEIFTGILRKTRPCILHQIYNSEGW